MRPLAIACLLVTLGALGYQLRWARTSYSDYSGAQLEALALEAATAPAHAGLDAEALETAGFSAAMIAQEERRRRSLPLLAGVALAFGAAAYFAPARRKRRRASPEEARLQDRLGRPEDLLAGERRKAAELLGVSVAAPPAVVQAALTAQLADRDPARLEGLAPELRRVAEQQRQALARAAELLLQASSVPAGAPPRNDR
jgi:hypothetical protein